MTQINYFKGNFIGCDSASGLAMPDWQILAKSFGINSSILDPNDYFSKSDILALNNEAPHIFIVPIDPNQTYYPKISSKIDKNGKITSNPLHMMTPKLSKDIEKKVFKYIDMEENE